MCIFWLSHVLSTLRGGGMACMEIVAGDEPNAGQERGGWGLSVK